MKYAEPILQIHIRERSHVTRTRYQTHSMMLFDLNFKLYFSGLSVDELELYGASGENKPMVSILAQG